MFKKILKTAVVISTLTVPSLWADEGPPANQITQKTIEELKNPT